MDFTLPASWNVLQEQTELDYFQSLKAFLKEQAESETILPPVEQIFAAFDATPYDKVKVLILGQDPYHDLGQAHGLCFSVLPGVKLPPSLKNIYKELESDLSIPPSNHGYLMSWAEQGVLLLNTVLTVRAHQANSHRKRGWETFTDAAIRAVAAKASRVVFVLWGKPAQAKRKLIEAAGSLPNNHVILESPHPSPLSASRGFFGSKPFSAVNDALQASSQTPIDWALPNLSDGELFP